MAGESCCPPDMTLVPLRFGARLWIGYPHVDVEPENILMRAGSGDEPLDLAVTLVLWDPSGFDRMLWNRAGPADMMPASKLVRPAPGGTHAGTPRFQPPRSILV